MSIESVPVGDGKIMGPGGELKREVREKLEKIHGKDKDMDHFRQTMKEVFETFNERVFNKRWDEANEKRIKKSQEENKEIADKLAEIENNPNNKKWNDLAEKENNKDKTIETEKDKEEKKNAERVFRIELLENALKEGKIKGDYVEKAQTELNKLNLELNSSSVDGFEVDNIEYNKLKQKAEAEQEAKAVDTSEKITPVGDIPFKTEEKKDIEKESKIEEESKNEVVFPLIEDEVTKTPEIKKELSLEEELKNITENLKEQPGSVQKIINEGIEFDKIKNINGRIYIFSGKGSDGKIIALINDSNNPKKWKTRAFHFSGSDHQWKSFPGLRADGDKHMKGDEDNKKHHYVQSAKLHPSVYKIIEELRNTGSIRAKQYLPILSGPLKRFSEEFEFKEDYEILKNEEWADYQEYCQDVFARYLNLHSIKWKYLNKEGWLYKFLVKVHNDTPEVIKNLGELLKVIEDMQKKYGEEGPSDADWLRLKSEYKKITGPHIIELFKESDGFQTMPQSMYPDFDNLKPRDQYDKEGEYSNIHIEEYEVKNPEGDDLIFAMAYDDKGRVYVDNVYDPRVGFNDYGNLNKIVQMGHLVYKPEDYEEQTECISNTYIKNARDPAYKDINALWLEIPVIKKYKESLVKRGVLKN